MQSEPLILAGFVAIRSTLRSSYMCADLVPWRVTSTSACIAAAAPGSWALDWVSEPHDARIDALRKFGIPDERLDALVDWTSAKFGHGIAWPGTFTDIETAREFFALFVPHEHDGRLLARCISLSDVSQFLDEATADLAPNQAEHAAITTLRHRASPPTGGIEIGTDILGIEPSGDFHSFLCNGLEKTIAEELSFPLNSIGLYQAHDEGRRAAQLIREVGNAEPVPWFAFRILEFPL